MRRLIAMGHRHIAVITGLAHTSPARMRLRGIHHAFREAGLVLDNSFVKNGDWEYASGRACMEDLLSQEIKPTAVFAMNDLMAAGAMDAIKAAGLRIPEDISVIGFDNRELASYLTPKLSTIKIDLKAIGLTAAKIALDQIRGVYSGEESVVIPGKIIMRDTVLQRN
jgi:LacI family transcriptional regulator